MRRPVPSYADHHSAGQHQPVVHHGRHAHERRLMPSHNETRQHRHSRPHHHTHRNVSALAERPPESRGRYPNPHGTPTVPIQSQPPQDLYVYPSGRTTPKLTLPRVECLTCTNTLPADSAAHLACGHDMCHRCLRHLFKLSLTDPALMPPRCCTTAPIPLRHVDNLLSFRFKHAWNERYRELATPADERLYCAVPTCSKWIPPDTTGSREVRCQHCNSRVCTHCRGPGHRGPCPDNPAEAALKAMAETQGWRECWQCHALVELREGCNHMTCRCGAQFCMSCGRKWKSCSCALFNDEMLGRGRGWDEFEEALNDDDNLDGFVLDGILDARARRLAHQAFDNAEWQMHVNIDMATARVNWRALGEAAAPVLNTIAERYLAREVPTVAEVADRLASTFQSLQRFEDHIRAMQQTYRDIDIRFPRAPRDRDGLVGHDVRIRYGGVGEFRRH